MPEIFQNVAGGQKTQVQPGAPQQQQQQQGVQALPATGIQQQVAGINQQQQGALGGMLGMQQPQQQGQPAQLPGLPMGQTSLTSLANRLAQSYGLPVGRQGLVDPQGNFLMTPDQIAKMSGGQIGMADAAAKMNYIAAAISRQQQRGSQQRARGALEAGTKLVQSRGRGSLAAMQSGFYENMAQLYASEEYEAADFSYFIQEDRFNRAMAQQRKLARKARKKGRFGAIGSIVGGLMGGPGGAAIGGALGSLI